MLTERYQSTETSKRVGDHLTEKILFERLRSVLLHQDVSVMKHNCQKKNKSPGFILFIFPAHGKLTIVKTCGVSTQSPCSDRSDLSSLKPLKCFTKHSITMITFSSAPLSLACGQMNVIVALMTIPTPAWLAALDSSAMPPSALHRLLFYWNYPVCSYFTLCPENK